jgi:Ser/Thr protein kinase RdoA (MazF antagonist)
MSSGFSGSALARVEAASERWCLRRWPAETNPETLQFIHTVLHHSRARGFLGVPRLAVTATGETVVCRDGTCFDAQEWIAGAPLARSADVPAMTPNRVCPLAPERLAEVAIGLADLHRSTSDLSPPPDARRPPLAQRLADVAQILDRQRAAIEAWAHAESDGDLQRLVEEWLSGLPGALSRAAAIPVAMAVPPDATCAAVHGDLWAPHVFFDGPSFTGFVDFESLAWDAPAIDLAQLILHFNGWQERATVLDAYAAARPLTTTDHQLLPAAAVLDLAGEGLWSLGALAAAAGRPPHRDRHITNLRALLASLHGLTEPYNRPRHEVGALPQRW